MTGRNDLSAELWRPIDLSGARTPLSEEFRVSTEDVHYAVSGTRLRSDRFTLDLRTEPVVGRAADVAHCTCMQLQVERGNSPSVSVPALHGLEYRFDPTVPGGDGQEALWGIPADKFVALSDTNGNPLPFEVRHAAYIGFVDFHSINNVFTRPMGVGPGIQNLKEMGQRVVHPASYIEAPVRFGSEILPGSVFRSGEVSLELKGVGVVDGAPCALIGYDGGEGHLTMRLQGSKGEPATTTGCSLYKGDICVDLRTRQVRRATLDEYQVAKTSPSDPGTSGDDFTVRHVQLRKTA